VLKETVRPLLVEALEHARRREEHHTLLLNPLAPEFLAEAKRERVRAEVTLWLADRQWEREAKTEVFLLEAAEGKWSEEQATDRLLETVLETGKLLIAPESAPTPNPTAKP